MAGPSSLWSFEGTWRLTRVIEDRAGPASGRLEGRATFRRMDPGLSYDEDGLLTLGDVTVIRARRRYLWALEDGCVAVRFEDGRAFHRFGLGQPEPEASHFCSPDLYHVSYDFTRWPIWRAHWRVEGPKKDYTLLSEYGPWDG